MIGVSWYRDTGVTPGDGNGSGLNRGALQCGGICDVGAVRLVLSQVQCPGDFPVGLQANSAVSRQLLKRAWAITAGAPTRVTHGQ